MIKKILDVYGREVNVETETAKMTNFDNTKKEIVMNAQIVEDGKTTDFYTDYIEEGIIEDIEDKLEVWNNGVKAIYAQEVAYDSDKNDPDGKIWKTYVDKVKANPEKFFTANGNWRKNFRIGKDIFQPDRDSTENLTAIEKFMKKHNITGYTVAKAGGFAASRVQAAKKKSINSLSVEVLKAIAAAANVSPGVALDEMLELED